MPILKYVLRCRCFIILVENRVTLMNQVCMKTVTGSKHLLNFDSADFQHSE
jgi:hypothetical protein